MFAKRRYSCICALQLLSAMRQWQVTFDDKAKAGPAAITGPSILASLWYTKRMACFAKKRRAYWGISSRAGDPWAYVLGQPG